MAVPYTFGSATSAIPLSQLDSNFATTITLGNTAIQLGNTVTTLNNMTLANVTVSSGNVTLTNATVSNANFSGSTSGTITVLANAVAGTNTITLPANTGTVITTGSSGQVIPKAALPTGSVLQVVSATYATQASTSSGTYADTGLTVSITPTSSSSKVLISTFVNGIFVSNVNAGFARFQLNRGSTSLGAFGYVVGYLDSATVGSNSNRGTSVAYMYLDSPATTSSTTYKVQFAQSNGATVDINRDNLAISSITVMEIAA